MDRSTSFYIDGEWVPSSGSEKIAVINPATEQITGHVANGNAADIDRAVAAAKRAFESFSQTTREQRIEMLERILAAYRERWEELAQATTLEMGAPITLSRTAQVWCGEQHIQVTIDALRALRFNEPSGSTMIRREPVGVCGMITPWNWPLNQIACKVIPAIAAGCTVVLKPSELSPYTALLFAQIMHDAGVPKGVFNLINGTGIDAGQPLSSHPDVDMVSFTGSTRAGISIAKAAADTVKRVAQELGGKSANIILEDADFEDAISKGVLSCFSNAGQSCNAPARLLVPADLHDEALSIARRTAEAIRIGDPNDTETQIGPVVSQRQFEKIQALIALGISEGAELVTGGSARLTGHNSGFFVRPTVFGNVTPDMTIAREEIFGPVICIMPYETEDDAVHIANDTVYGLAGYVQSRDIARARKIAERLRVGVVQINYPAWDPTAPYGGYKQSGNGREYGEAGIQEFLEIKSIVGHG